MSECDTLGDKVKIISAFLNMFLDDQLFVGEGTEAIKIGSLLLPVSTSTIFICG